MLGFLASLLLAVPVDADTSRSTVPAPTPADSSAVRRGVVREFPPVEVRALVHDLRSSQTVHLIPGSVVRSYPIDGLTDLIALQPGVVFQGDELHVRGGRSGELAVSLDGINLNEPFRRRPIEVPLLAVRSAELVSGAPDAQYGGGLAGILKLDTVNPGERLAGEWRWQTDGRVGTHYDRVAARLQSPLPAFGLGVVVAGDALLDDTFLPMARTKNRHEVAGLSFGWRAENRLLGYVKLAPTRRPDRFSAQLLVNRQVRLPYNPSFTVDGWVYVPANLKVTPTFSPVPQPGYHRYRAADHVAMTDDHSYVALLEMAASGAARRGSIGLGWMRTRTLTSLGNRREPESASHRPRYGSPLDVDLFYAMWGDYPLYRESASDVFSARCDGEIVTRTGGVMAGAGLTYENVSMLEMDWSPFASRAGDEGFPFPVDSIRKYQAQAPGGFAYLQGRWLSGGMVMNAGLRAEYFTPGGEAVSQTLPGTTDAVWSFAPRLGLTYPISPRDAFSLAYVRVHQSPGRDFLYDQRTVIGDRQPLGNPAISPSVLISYEAAVKHVFGPSWALQAAVFHRDVFGQIGALDAAIPEGPVNLRYTDQDESHALGFEWSLIHADGDRRRLEAHYVWMTAWGNESRPEGDPYGPVRSAETPPITDQALSWDRRHTVLLSGFWPWRRNWSVSWSTALMSPLPWTPKPRRAPLTDLGLVNSRRLAWTENTNLGLGWSPRRALSFTFGLEVRNLFDHRSERAATLDGYPNPTINTLYDDYGAYRTATGLGGGGYWSNLNQSWVAVHDPRLMNPPRSVRASISSRW